jgi:hypothetical protein
MEYDRLYYLQNEDKKKDSAQRYYSQNEERKKNSNRRYRLENEDKSKDYSRKYSAENESKMKEYLRGYNLQHKDLARESNRQYRIRTHDHPETYLPRVTTTTTLKSWKTPELVREYFDSIAGRLQIANSTDWYRVSRAQIRSLGGV